MRTFVAVEVNDQIKRNAMRLQDRLKRTLPGDWKMTSEDHVHLTLVFLGDISGDGVGPVVDAVVEVARTQEPFEVEFAGLGAFPHAHSPRVVWVGLGAGDQSLRRIHKGLRTRLAHQGFQLETRDFHPHLTLARSRCRSTLLDITPVMERHAATNLGRQHIRELVVVESVLSQQGSEYSVRCKVPLTP